MVDLSYYRAVSDENAPSTLTFLSPGEDTPDGSGGFSQAPSTSETHPARLSPPPARILTMMKEEGRVIPEGPVMASIPYDAEIDAYALVSDQNGNKYEIKYIVPKSDMDVVRRIIMRKI